MARIRTIKPEFWTSEQIMQCSRDARLLFIGLFNFSDDGGNQPYSPLRLKAQIFPSDLDLTKKEIEVLFKELSDSGLIEFYQVEEQVYISIPKFNKHQKIDNPSKQRFPHMSNGHKVCIFIPDTRVVLTESSCSTKLLINEDSPLEGKGREGKGKEEDLSITIQQLNNITTYSDIREVKKTSPAEVLLIFDYWKEIMQHAKAKLDNKRKKLISEALKLGYTVQDLQEAILGCKNTPWNMGDNPGGKRFDSIELILRDAQHIDRFRKNLETAGMSRSDVVFQEAADNLIKQMTTGIEQHECREFKLLDGGIK